MAAMNPESDTRPSVETGDAGELDCDGDGLPDAAAAKARIRERGRRICREERERAIQRLRDRRTLTDREEDVVGELARSLTEELLAVPEAHLVAVEEEEADAERAAVALALFGDESGDR